MQPSRARYWVIFYAVTLAVLSYVSRVCIAQAAPLMSKDLGLDKAQMGVIFGAFALSYAAFEIPSGWLGDLIGPRKVLMRIVVWWSVFTALTGAMWSFWSLWVVRFLFGAGEAGCFPNLTKAFSTWLPSDERVRAQGIMWTFARWGGAFTPPLVVLVLAMVSWRMSFVIFGAIGIVWAVFFYGWFRDDPHEHPSVNAAERELIAESAHPASGHGNVPWLKLVGSKSIWLLWLQYFCVSYPWYFYITWLPTYLQEHFHLSQKDSASFGVLPLLFGGFGALSAGFASARVARMLGGSVVMTRRVLACSGCVAAGLLLLLVTKMEDPVWAMLVMGLASFSNDLSMPGAWAACMDIGGKYAGTVAGSMNMMGNFAGFVAPAVGGMILKAYPGHYEIFIYTMAASYILALVAWMILDPVTPMDAPRPAGPLPVTARSSH